MNQQKKQLILAQQFLVSATCLKNKKVSRICINSTCKQRNIFQCKTKQQCQCHYQHKNCASISYESFCNKVINYRSFLNEQVGHYIERFEKVYSNLDKKLKKQLSLFKNHYSNILFSQILSSIQNKILNKHISTLTSYEISKFLDLLQTENQQFNCGKMTLKQARQLDKNINQLFQQIENIYKQKLTKKKSTQKNKIRSYSSGCLQKSTCQNEAKTSPVRNSTTDIMAGISNVDTFAFFNKNFSVMLEKSKTRNIMHLNFNQNLLLKPPKINLDYPRVLSSKIIQNSSVLNSFIGKKIKSYDLCFRASENNFEVKRFYEKVDDQYKKRRKISKNQSSLGNLFLIKTEYNQVLGCYSELFLSKHQDKLVSKQSVQSSEQENDSQFNPENIDSKKRKKFISDIRSSTFLFSLSLKQKYALTDPQKAVYLGSKSLGFGNTDLRIRSKANQFRENHCRIGDTFKSINSSKDFTIDYDYKNLKIIGSRYGKKFKILQWQHFFVNFPEEK